MFFNEFMNYQQIVSAYTLGGVKPNAHCYLWNKSLNSLIATEEPKIIQTQRSERSLARDGVTKLFIH